MNTSSPPVLRSFASSSLALVARLVLVCFALLLAPAQAAESPAQEVQVGVLSFRSLDHTRSQWTPLADYLSQRLPGYRFNIVPLFYPDLDQAVARHELDLVLTNPEHYVLLRSRHGLAAQATLMPMAGNFPASQFGGVVLVRQDRTDLQGFSDLQGKRIASPSDQSLGGYLMQRWALLKEGVDITRDIRDLQFTGMPHDKVVLDVVAGHADAGFVRTGVIESMLAEGRLRPGQVRVLKQQETPDFPLLLSTDLYPEWPFSATNRLPGWFSKQVVHALLELEADSSAARAGKFFGFAPAGDYSQIEAIMVKLRVHPDHQLTIDDVLDGYSHWLVAGFSIFLVVIGALVYTRRANYQLRAALAEADRLALRDALLESLGEGVIGIDNSGRISFINATALASLGYARGDALGLDLHAITHHHHPDGQDYSREECPIFATLHSGRPYSGEEWYYRKNGEGFSVSLNVRPIVDAAGRIQGAVTAFQDITLEKRNHDELARYRHHLEDLVARRTAELARAMTAAEAANQAKSAFLANMSHEIRTPMNAIVGLTHLLCRDIQDPTHQGRLIKVSDAAKHLLGIINDILDFSKIEAGKLCLETTDFNVAQLLGGVSGLMEDKIREKGLILESVIEPALAGTLRGDPMRLSQVLLNYLSNAIKFTEHGHIRLRARVLEESGPDLLLRFEVADSGIGIAPDRLPRLFQSFEQADSSTTRKYGGTGLGLAISRRLAELMGGQAGAESVPGQGSTFWFTVRLQRSSAAAAVGHESPCMPSGNLLAALRGRRVLLVEDNPINQEVALDLLQEVGIRADLAGDGREAVARARVTDYELILMDVQMPIMDGLAATAAIRRLPGHGTTPILAMTASVFIEEQNQCLDIGMNDLVPKPVDPKVLFAALAKWLPERRQRELPMPAPAPVEPTEEGQRSALAGIEGLDMSVGLRSVRGKLPSYIRLLRKFVLAHGDDLILLQGQIEAGDQESARRTVHTLKGIAGTLGAMRVQAMALELESAIRDAPPGQLQQTDFTAQIAPLGQELSILRETLLSILSVEEAPPAAESSSEPVPLNPEEAAVVLRQLDELLQADDMGAVAHLREHQVILERVLPEPVLTRLRQQVEDYDFHSALETWQEYQSARSEVPV